MTCLAAAPARPKKSKKRSSTRGRRARIETLESKDLLNADWSCETVGCPQCGGALCACGLPQLNATSAITQQLNAVAAVGTPSAATYPLSSIQNLHSRAGATAKIYLDFNGHFDAVWGTYSNVSTPVFDFDGNASTFSDSELATIQEVWQRVAEDFAPFNVDVTTQDPGNFSDGVGLRVAIGGSGSWYGSAGGVAYVNSFTNPGYVNTAYVFSGNLGNGNAKYVAEASSHEAGHAFGLVHQSAYDAQGNLTANYSQGTADWAPIMGVGYYSDRSTWANGPTASVNTLQDNLAVLSNGTNGFGYAADDHGNTGGTATALTVNGANATGAGIVGQMSDEDYFSFSTLAGSVSFTVNVASVGANLDAKVELRSTGGTLIASADPGNSLSATVTASVSAGSYYLVVMCHGTYGDLGNYSIAGTVQAVPDVTPPAAQADSASTANNSSVAINVVGNDTDAGGVLNPGSVQIVGNAGHGVLSVNPTTGVVTYTPQSGYVGTDSFMYVVRDAAGNVSNAATVTVSVTAPPPVVVQNNNSTPPKNVVTQANNKVVPKVTVTFVNKVVTKVVTTKVNGVMVKKVVKVIEKVPVKTVAKTTAKK